MMTRLLLTLGVLWIATGPAWGGKFTVGYSEREQGVTLVRTYSAGLEAHWPGVALSGTWFSPDLQAGDLRLTLTGEWFTLKYAGGDTLPVAWSLSLKRTVGPGLLSASYSEAEPAGKLPYRRDLDLQWQAEF